MGSRIRENPLHIFECYLELSSPVLPYKQPAILKKYPDSFKDEELLRSVPLFAYPCDVENNGVQHFSFVLTNHDSKWTFGFCRQAEHSSTPSCLVMLSYLPWHETFYRLLNHLAELDHRLEESLQDTFLENLYYTKVPEPGFELHFTYNNRLKEYTTKCPDNTKLPSIPESRNLTEYFNALDPHNMMVIFASMLHERRILITSKRLSRLSACVQAANSLIYPMFWQHIFIPILPLHLLEYLSAPMPFLIGVPASTLAKYKKCELGEVVILDADTNTIESSFSDLDNLPTEIVISLKKSFKNPNSMLGSSVSRAFLKAIVQLIGGYWNALKLKSCERITFNPEDFVQTRSIAIQPFLQKMLELQIFQQFIEARLRLLNNGEGFTDEFEFEVSAFEGKPISKIKQQYKEWLTSWKKGGEAFLKNVKTKVKDTSKQAYRELCSKLNEIQHQKLTKASGTSKDWSLSRRVSHPFDNPTSPFRNKVTSYVRPSALESTSESLSWAKDGKSNLLSQSQSNKANNNTDPKSNEERDSARAVQVKKLIQKLEGPEPPPRINKKKDTLTQEDKDLIQLDSSTPQSSTSNPIYFAPPAPRRPHASNTNPFGPQPLSHTLSFPVYNNSQNPFSNWQTFQ